MQRILKHVMNDEKKDKKYRLAILRMLISSKEISSQRELLQQLAKENVEVTQATLSRDLKQLKVAKAASMNGSYVYVLPNETMYKRVVNPATANEMLHESGVLTITFSGTMGVIKTRPGYASAIAYDIDNADRPQILGTIAGDNTIFIVVREGTDTNLLAKQLGLLIGWKKGKRGNPCQHRRLSAQPQPKQNRQGDSHLPQSMQRLVLT